MSSEVEPLLHACTNCAAMLDVSEQEPFAEIVCPSCGARMRVRTRFDHFELTEAIASGGMGTVYKARDLNLDRIVALKLLRKEFSVDEEYIEKLETEAKITASVSHPHVVKVFSFGCDQGLYYIAMELVDKGSLDDLMGLQSRIAEVQVLEIGIQVAQGLRAALEAGLIHRDVKPGNILFADARTSKIVDFGLAMPLEQAKDAEGGEIWGTPYYVAPEKLNHEPEDFRSDIYSLGGTLFHALAGRPPFEADNASMVALKHIKSQVVSLQAFAPDISSPTAYVINRTLAKDPAERYQSYDELIEHLEYARAKLLENSGKPRQEKPRVVIEGEQQQQIVGYFLIGAIAFVLLVGGGFFLFKDRIMTRGMGYVETGRRGEIRYAISAEDGYSTARGLIFDGEPESAVPLLWQLAARRNVPQPLKSWILVQEGIASYLAQLPGNAHDAFASLRKSAAEMTDPDMQALSSLFQDLSVLDVRDLGPVEDVMARFSQPGNASLGLLIAGFAEWQKSHFDNAAKYFDAFLLLDQNGEAEWINNYKPLVQHYVDDYKAASGILQDFAARKPVNPATLEGLRKKLRVRGALPDSLARQESLLSRKGSQVAMSIKTFRLQTLALIQSFQPEKAKKMVEDAAASWKDSREYATLARQVDYAVEFKTQLIADLNAQGFSGTPIARKKGGDVAGRVLKADESGIELETPGGKQTLSWTELKEDAILTLAASMIKTRSGGTPDKTDQKRLWCSGAYAALLGRDSEALPRLMRAAEANREYARALPLFDSLSR